MVGIFSAGSHGLGGSIDQLGIKGLLGNPAAGRGKENFYLNAASGNLVVRRGDEYLAAKGDDLGVIRTYNSQGGFDGDNNDGWRMSAYRWVESLTGTANTAGSTITRVDGDGRRSLYTYDAVKGVYSGVDGSGANDTLGFDASGGVWTWNDGATERFETYQWDAAAGRGRLTRLYDGDGNEQTYQYGETGLLSKVRLSSGESVVFTYAGANLESVSVLGSDEVQRTRTGYQYDALGRLSQVRIKLGDDNDYTIAYTYDGDSKRLASVQEKDGTHLAFSYVEAGGQYRLATITDVALNRITSFSYDMASNTTLVTDALGGQTVLRYDSQGRLLETSIQNGGVANVVKYTYDTDGRVTSATDAAGRKVSYGYDAAGNRIWQQNETGDRIESIYDGQNRLLSEKRIAPNDPNSGRTTRHAYDGQGHRRFTVSGAGRVVEYRYDGQGQLIAEMRYAGAAYAGSADLAALESWAAEQDKMQAELTEYAYDFRGQLSSVKRYAATLADGTGDAGGTVQVSHYVYDQHGRLLSRLDGNGAGTIYTYDDLDRVLTSSSAGHVTSYSYDDALNRTAITTADNVQSVRQYSAAGELLSVTQAGAVTAYEYDKKGRLRRETDPTGVRKYYLYDSVDRLIAVINGNDGKMVEYGYSKRGYLAKTVEYANALSATQLTQLTTAGTSGVAPLFGNIADLTPYRPVKNAVQDREQWDLYDDQGRLAKRIDAVNGLTEYQYGGAGEVLATIRYATAFTGWARNSLTVDTPPESVVGTASSADPIERRIYDADGKLLAAIDAENGLTEYRYDGAGRLTQMTGYANRIAATASLRPKLEDIRPAASPEDQHTYHWYDDRGLLIATVDAERYLTTYQYDGNGRRTAVVRHAGKLTVAVPGSTVEAMRANAQVPGKDQAASYEYDGRGLLVKETAANGLVTAYEYSGDGRLLKRIQGAGTAQSRTVLRTYDSKGRLWKETDGVGRATTYEYDQADRLASKTDGNGNKTVYYYDAQNRLAYEINALGEVRQTVYDQFSQVVQRISYGNRIDTAVTLPSLAGGLVNETLRQAVNGIANSAKDSKLRWEYNQVGRLALTADANNYTTYSAQYDVLGNLRQSYHHWGGRTLRTDYLYDKLGRATQQQKRDNNNNVVTAQEQYAYDAFGRLIKQTDPRGGITVTEYDRLGRVITVSDPLNQKRRSTYDAFNRVLTHTDALDRTTTYSYSADHSSVTVTSPEGISVTTESNLYGQTVKVTDGNGKSTTYAYDQEGRLTQATDAANNTVTHAYAANKMTVTDASGVVTEHVYDAAGRTSKVTVDPGGLKLVTTYDYDGKGQQIRVTDPAGFVTETQFNLNGHVTAVSYGTNNSVDRTTYYRDTQGNITQVTEGGDYLTRTTQYQYDHLLRRVAEIVDPNGLQLKTTYTYDAAGNMVARTDPEGRIWRYGYDANNRLVLSVAPDGVATSYVYDANGRQIKKTVHATPLSGLPAPADMAASSNWAANIVPAVTAEDRSDHTVYDRDGRIRYTIDAARRVTGYEYDGNGKVVKTTRYARTDWSRDAGNKLTIAASGEDRLTGAVYDAVGRALYTVDELGRVTGYAYDKAGRQARRIEYGTTIAWPKTTPLTAGDLEGLSAAGAVRSGQVYDGAGRVRAAVDASGRVTSYTYGPGGQVATTTEHAVAADWTGDATIESQAAAIVAEPHALNRTETAIYDKAGRVAYRINAQREVTLYQYDGGGLLIGSTQFAKRYTGTAMDKASLDAYYAQYSPNRSAQDRTEYLVRDRAGRLAYKVDALRQVTRYQYNKLGELVGSVQYATKYSEWGGIDKSYLDSYYSSSSNLSAQDRQTAVVQDLAKHLRYEIDAAGRVRVVHYNNFGQADRVTELGTVLANWSTRKLGTNPVTLSELETLASQGGGRIVSRSVYDNAGQLLYEQDAQGRVTGYSYDAFGAVTVTTQYVNSGSFAAASDGSNGAYTAPAAANGDRREAVVQALGERKTYRIDAAGRVTVEERNAFGQVVKVVQAGTVVAGWSTRGEAADALAADQLKNLAESGANAADNRIVSRTVYDAGGRAVYEVGAQGQVSKTLYDAFGAVRARISYAALYSGALTQEALDAYYKIPAEGEGPNPNLSAEDRQTAVVQDLAKHLRYEIDAAGRVRVVHYNNFGQADRVTELGTVLPNWSTRNLGANPVTLSELETLASQGGNRVVSRMVYDNAGQLRYEQDAQGRVTGYGYDAFGAVTVMTQYVNSGSFAGTSDGSNGAYTTPAAANGDRREAVVQVLGERKTYRIDAAGRVTVEERNAFGETVKVVQAGTVVPGWSTRGDAADALAADKLKSLVESGANAADNRIVSRTVYDAGGRAVYEVGAQGQA
ncbi:MAG TPA: hypothetical protein VEC06_13565, partial [Paucimonas sp.]|nr:hypothetical protein [Paucimonas sp.]